MQVRQRDEHEVHREDLIEHRAVTSAIVIAIRFSILVAEEGVKGLGKLASKFVEDSKSIVNRHGIAVTMSQESVQIT